jgi:quercetin dioxygenase-like cupin family protein
MGETLFNDKIRIDLGPIKKAKDVLKELGVMQDHITGETIAPRMSFLTKQPEMSSVLELEVPGGNGFLFDIWKEEEDRVSFTKVFFSEGSIVEKHEHKVIEIFVIYQGSCEVCIFDDNDNITEGPFLMKEFDSYRFEPGIKHSVKFLEDTRHLLMTMPAYNLEADLPNADD